MDGNASDAGCEVDDKSDSQVPDGGWGWMVVLGSLVINIIYDGCSYSFGILFTNLLDDFEDTKSNTAWIGSLFFSVPLLCGPIAGKVIARIGHRKGTILGGIIAAFGFATSSFATSTWILCLTYGLIAGVGMSFPYFTSGIIVIDYFHRRRGLAVGIVECGAGAGTIVFAPFTEYLISQYGWRGAVLILSGVVLNITVCGMLFRPVHRVQKMKGNASETEQLEILIQKESDNVKHRVLTDDPVKLLSENEVDPKKDNSRHHRKNTNCLHLRNRTFLIFTISNFVMYFWYDVPYVFVVDKAVSLGIEISRATVLVTCIGILHTFGNIMYGVLSDRKWVNRTLLYGLSITFCGVSILFMGILKHFVSMSFAVGSFGLFSSASEAMCSLILVDIVGVQSLEDGYGVIMLLQGVANLVGPPFAGKLLFKPSTARDILTFHHCPCISEKEDFLKHC